MRDGFECIFDLVETPLGGEDGRLLQLAAMQVDGGDNIPGNRISATCLQIQRAFSEDCKDDRAGGVIWVGEVLDT